MFEVIAIGEKFWGVFLVNPTDKKDRYLLTSPLDKKAEANHFADEFRRILNVAIQSKSA